MGSLSKRASIRHLKSGSRTASWAAISGLAQPKRST